LQCKAVQECHTYLLTYYPTGTRVPDKLPGRVPGNELLDNGSPSHESAPSRDVHTIQALKQMFHGKSRGREMILVNLRWRS